MKKNDVLLVGWVSACLAVAAVSVALSCTKNTVPVQNTTDAHLADGATASLADVCKHLVAVGCGHDASACVTGLTGEVDSGLVLVDLACAISSPDAVTAAGCKGIGTCPP